MSGEFVTAILLAGGRGERANAGAVAGDAAALLPDLPKQFADLAGRPVLVHPLETLAASPRVSSIVVVLPEDGSSFDAEALRHPKVASIATGGPTRQASLGEGMACIPEETSVVLVHDAARPLLPTELIDGVLGGLDGSHHGAICALPVEDAIKEVSADERIVVARARRGLWRAQTPQAFLRASLEDAIARAVAGGIDCEDCSEMLTRAGYLVKVVRGDPWNIKITFTKDFYLAESILRARSEARDWTGRATAKSKAR